ncbi:homoserine O-acetyltransferase MetX [Virgibacillus oceani]|uniref:Homoserine O-acetyltransferase n=1 Tax=Virgibacillus oceani TaxID=1479511 RepID=A0A917M1R4_9BACI|nr:homoserine O-acetyltransferase [Virgibacillus oceani]GGG71212.1 homoserine O-acetyltransferase [Virgibacillus oceani]
MSKTLIKRFITGCVSFGPFHLTSGETLERVTLHYESVGPASAPVILVCHALTGNHYTVGTEDNPGWWDGLIGTNKYIDTDKFQVITFNVLGGCDGSTGPTSLNPNTSENYRADFPAITIRDMVHATHQALQELQIRKLAAVIGGSLGGMQVLEWGLLYPAVTDKLIILAATPVFSDYGIAFNHIASSAIKADRNWNDGFYEAEFDLKGLEIARMIGMVTYRSSDLFSSRFNREKANDDYRVSTYLDYQGEKLMRRFDPNSYLTLLNAMNSHDVGLNRGGWRQAVKNYQCPLLTISFDNDLIYEPKQIKELSEHVPDSFYYHVQTDFGHDGFLTQFERWGHVVKEFLE